jgi:hypothetical protein
MGRMYTVSTENVSVSAAQDLAQIKGASSMALRIYRVFVGATDTSIPTAQMLQLRCQYLPATVTDGSGGTTPTARRLDPGDAAATFTALANNTTPASSNGTAVTLAAAGVHIYAGWDYQFPAEARPVVIPSTSFTFGLLSTVSGTVHLSTMVWVEEIG